MSQSLAKDFNFRSLLKFAFPSIIMMIFMSLYSIVDGFFIAQYVDSMALSAANIVYPAVSILLAVGIMFGTGGSAVVAAKIGQGKQAEGAQQEGPIAFPNRHGRQKLDDVFGAEALQKGIVHLVPGGRAEEDRQRLRQGQKAGKHEPDDRRAVGRERLPQAGQLLESQGHADP